MRKPISKYHRKLKFTFIKSNLILLGIAALFLPSYVKWENTGDNKFTIIMNGNTVGVVANEQAADEYMKQARKEIASTSDTMTFIDVDLTLQGEEVLWGVIDTEDKIIAAMKDVMLANVKETTHKSYIVKVNNYMVNLSSSDEVKTLLQAAVAQYDTQGQYQVDLELDDSREFNVLTAKIADQSETINVSTDQLTVPVISGGWQANIEEALAEAEPDIVKGFDDYDLGIQSMNFAEEVEIVEAYLDESQLTPVEQAIEEVTKEQEKNTIYEIVSGDTLSEIAIKVNIPLDRIVELNENLENENSMIRVGDELIVTIPEPELSVDRVEQVYYEGSYDAEIIYVPNDNWYTNQKVTLQEPSAGFHRVVANVSYTNNTETGSEILLEEVLMEAVPKIVERGTKIPPTYIKPISGGRQTSGFGKRSAPKKGASTYHKGIDWAVPTGTAVFASSGGTVVKAGWGSGYGYVVYINHADGRQTRYGHLSKVLVNVGQTVSQGDKIALSGNTGVSTGPHLHFEILINGSQVNPLNYLN